MWGDDSHGLLWSVNSERLLYDMRNIYDLSIRDCGDNPNHHLWNNNGIWWVHFTVYPTPVTTHRVRRSLRTRELEEAKRKRDRLLKLSGSLLGVRAGVLSN